MWGGGGGGRSKNWASSFRVILGFLMVSLQFEPADAGVLVEHPVPRCRSCTPVLFGVHVNSPDKYFIIIPCETNIFSCHGDILNSLLEYFHHSDVRTELHVTSLRQLRTPSKKIYFDKFYMFLLHF